MIQLHLLLMFPITTAKMLSIAAASNISIITPAHDAINAAANDPIFCTLGHVGKSFPTFSHSFISNAQTCQ